MYRGAMFHDLWGKFIIHRLMNTSSLSSNDPFLMTNNTGALPFDEIYVGMLLLMDGWQQRCNETMQ